MTPLTITKDEYREKFVAWHLPSEKVIKFTSEGQSQVFWKCTSNFYFLGVGDTEETAVKKLESEITDFTNWLNKNGILLGIDYISSNLPEYRQAIYEFNTQNYQHTDNV